MGGFVSVSKSDLQPSGCVICGEECGHGALCAAHQGINALAAWVDDGLVSDWTPELGSEALNHRTMLVHPPVGAATPVVSGWLEQLAVIVRRFGYWVGRDRDQS